MARLLGVWSSGGGMTIELAVQVAAAFGLAAFVATVVGFGNALIAMPFLIGLVGVRTAAPMMALSALLTWTVLFARLRHDVARPVIGRIIGAAIVTIPVGVTLVSRGPEVWLRAGLGVLTVGYVLHRWLGRRVMRVDGDRWTWGVGLIAGVLSGAFNTAGPLVVAYGTAREWPPEPFRANLAAFFAATLVVTNINHLVAGNFGALVVQGFAVGVPAVLVAIPLGRLVAARIDADRFARLVLILLFVVGVRLALSPVL